MYCISTGAEKNGKNKVTSPNYRQNLIKKSLKTAHESCFHLLNTMYSAEMN